MTSDNRFRLFCQGFHIELWNEGGNVHVTCEHDYAERSDCDQVARAFIRAMQNPELREEIIGYNAVHTKLPEILDIPAIGASFEAEERLARWLHENHEFVPMVEEALRPHGYPGKVVT